MCREARGGACVGYAEGHAVDGGRHGSQGNGARDSTEGDERVREAQCTNCEASSCELLGEASICTRCNAGKVPIDGQCQDASTVTAKCTKAADDSAANQVCEKCKGQTFMYKGGCYETTATPGKTMCKTAEGGKCIAAVETKEYSTIPAADRDPTKPSVVACGDTVGVTVNGKTYTGVDGCTKCTEPKSLSTAGTKAATCEACSPQESTPRIVKTAAGVTSCVTEEECTGTKGFFVKDGTPKTCVACNENCKTCAGTEANQCTSCKTDTPYLKKADNSQTGTCVNKAGCTDDNTYYADDTVDPTSGKLCRKCAEGGLKDCTTCEKSADDLVCKECTGKKFGLNKKSCVTECPANSQAGSDNVCKCNDGFTRNADSSACVAASSSANLSTGAIAGISVAAVVVVGGLVGFLCWWFLCRGKA